VTSAAIQRPSVGKVYLWLVALSSGLVAIEYFGQRLGVRRFADDFEPTFWDPWHALRAGLNPYPDPAAPFADGNPFPYPPLAAELTLPLSWLPFGTAAVIFSAGLAVSAALTLWALNVREPALWAIWMLSAAVVGAVAGGNATLFVILAVALTWRWRDRPAWAAAALTAGIVLKLFVWPVWLWLLFTRRYRAAIYTSGATACLILASWAIIGFRGLADYPALLSNASEYLGERGLLAYALTEKVSGPTAARSAALAVATILLAGAFLRRNDDRAAITLALLAALYATPIVWLHYFGLLVIPAALYGSWVWAAIPLLALSRLTIAGAPKPSWMIVCFIAITGVVAARALVGYSFSSRAECAASEARKGLA
jgi:glycosyl transferase family 87